MGEFKHVYAQGHKAVENLTWSDEGMKQYVKNMWE